MGAIGEYFRHMSPVPPLPANMNDLPPSKCCFPILSYTCTILGWYYKEICCRRCYQILDWSWSRIKIITGDLETWMHQSPVSGSYILDKRMILNQLVYILSLFLNCQGNQWGWCENTALLCFSSIFKNDDWSDLYFLILPNDHQLSDLFGEKIWGEGN